MLAQLTLFQAILSAHSISQSFTGYREFMIGIIAASVFLTYKILNRGGPDPERKSPGCVGYGYVFLVVFCVLSLGIGSLAMLITNIHSLVTQPRYQAVIIGYTSYKDNSRNSKGRSRNITMYTPIVRFKDSSGQIIEIESDLSSSGRAPVGSTIEVNYSGSEKATEVSFTKYFMLLGLATITFVLIYALVFGISYAFGWRLSALKSIGSGFLFYYLFPAGMLLLLWGCGYGAYSYISGEIKDFPLWAFLVCCFFFTVLLFSFPAYIKLLRTKNKGEEDSEEGDDDKEDDEELSHTANHY